MATVANSSAATWWNGDPASDDGRRAASLGARPLPPTPPPGSVVLERRGGHLQARLAEWPAAAGVRAKWDPRRLADARRSPVVRAMGRPGGIAIDATAGLGVDAMSLAAAGWRVIACERNPIVGWLLEEGLREASQDPAIAAAAAAVERRDGDAAALLAELAAAGERVAAVLLDPMFPRDPRSKSLPPKEAQILRAIVGEDPAAADLVAAARAVASRVAVKRPPHAPPLAGGSIGAIRSKLLRIDLYGRVGLGEGGAAGGDSGVGT